jgi:hypothetical protein
MDSMWLTRRGAAQRLAFSRGLAGSNAVDRADGEHRLTRKTAQQGRRAGMRCWAARVAAGLIMPYKAFHLALVVLSTRSYASRTPA